MTEMSNFFKVIHVDNWEKLNQSFEDKCSQLPRIDGSFDRGFIYEGTFTAVFLGSYTRGGGSWDSWILENEIYSFRDRGPVFRVDKVISDINLIVEVVVPRNGFKVSWDDLESGEIVEITGRDFHHFKRVAYRAPLPKWKTTDLVIRGTRDELLINLSEQGCEVGTVALTESGQTSVCVKKVIDPQNKRPDEYHWFNVGSKMSLQTEDYGPATLTLVQVDKGSDSFVFEVTKVSTILNLPTKNLRIGQKLVLSFSGLLALIGKDIDDQGVAESLR